MLLLYLGLLVTATTILCELAAKRDWIPYWVSRKILHVVAVGSCAVAGYTADSLGHRELLTWIVAGAEVVLIGLVGFGGLMREESGRRAWGIVWFPLAFLVLLVTTEQAEMIGFCMAVLAVCDPAATVAGKVLGNRLKSARVGSNVVDDLLISPSKRKSNHPFFQKYSLTGDPKTPIGSLFFLFSFGVLCYCFPSIGTSPVIYESEVTTILNIHYVITEYTLSYLFAVGILLTLGEGLGSRGLDNLIVPLLCAYFMCYVSDFFYNTYRPPIFLGVVIVGLLFAYFAGKRKSLTAGGALTAAILGLILFPNVGIHGLAPLLLFFLSSVFIGRLFPSTTIAVDLKHKKPRDAVQVLANGGVYGLIVIGYAWLVSRVHPPENTRILIWLLLLITAATATADTWSSELGQYFRRPTWDLVKWRRVPAGLSGGVSWPGTLAGLGGAALIANLGWWLLPEPTLSQILLITGFGFLGMFLDSVLGSLFQATYRDPATGALSDVRPEGGELASGFPWMTNDLVNFLAIAVTALVAALLL